MAVRSGHGGRLPSIEMVSERVVAPWRWVETASGIVALFAGTLSAAYVAGPLPPLVQSIVPVTVALLFVMAIAGCLRRRSGGSRLVAASLLGGVAMSLVAFHVVAGPAAVTPDTERYGLFLIAPLAIIFALGVDAWGERWRHVRVVAPALMCACMTAVLALGYFGPLINEGGNAHQTFRTGRREPKAAAVDFIVADSTGAPSVVIVAENWWVYWPIRYLAAVAADRIHVAVMPEASMPGGLYPAGTQGPVSPQQPDKTYAVVFDGSDAWQRVKTQGPTVFSATDPLGRPILRVVEMTAGANQRPSR